jgi:hypothetical protein
MMIVDDKFRKDVEESGSYERICLQRLRLTMNNFGRIDSEWESESDTP